MTNPQAGGMLTTNAESFVVHEVCYNRANPVDTEVIFMNLGTVVYQRNGHAYYGHSNHWLLIGGILDKKMSPSTQ